MATTYNYGLVGIGANVQLGRRGGYIDWSTANGYRFFAADNSTLANVRVATTPTDANDATSKSYVDALVQGIAPKESVRVATTAAGTLASDFEAGDTVDGVVLVAGDRILIKDQADPIENGIYVVEATGTPTRAADADSATDLGAAFTFVEEGTANANGGWNTSFDSSGTLGTDPVVWSQFSAAGAFTASNGVQIVGSDIRLDLDGLTSTTAVVGADKVVFYDTSGAAHLGRTFTDVIADLSILTTADVPATEQAELAAIDALAATTGVLVRTGDASFVARTIGAAGAGATAGIAITDGDGVAGAPTIGLDIQNLPVQTAIDTTDRVAVYDQSAGANVYYTVSDLAGALAATNSFETIAISGNTTGDASVVADASTDTLTLNAGIGISLAGTAASDTIGLSFTNSGMADTTVVAADTIPFFDASNGGEAEFRAFSDVITDLGIRTGTVPVTDGGTGLTTVAANSILVANTADTITAVTATDAAGDQLLLWNDTTDAFEFVTAASLGGSSFGTIALGGNTTGDASLVADQVNDTLTINGGAGISIAGTAASDTAEISLTTTGLVDTAVVGADQIAVFDASASDAPIIRSFTNIVADLDIVNGITVDGFVVRTAADTYASRTITASATAGQEGVAITDGDGIAANPTIGLDITGLTADTATAATDEFVYFNGTNNVKIDRDSLANELAVAANGMVVAEASVALAGTAVATVPANARIQRIRVVIDTAYDNAPDLSISGATAGTVMDENDIAEDITAIFETNVDYRTVADEVFSFVVGTNVPTTGAARVYIEYFVGSAI